MIVTPAKETLNVLQMFHTIHFNMHVHSFEVCASNFVNVYRLDELLDHLPLHFCNFGKSRFLFVCPKNQYKYITADYVDHTLIHN